MKYHIMAARDVEEHPELKALLEFLTWQRCSYELSINVSWTLREAGGDMNAILVYDTNGTPSYVCPATCVANGFGEFYEWYQKQGLMLC